MPFFATNHNRYRWAIMPVSAANRNQLYGEQGITVTGALCSSEINFLQLFIPFYYTVA